MKTVISKKAKVREWFKQAQDGTKMTINEYAIRIGVTSKDVDNVVREMKKGGAIHIISNRDKGTPTQYEVDSNLTTVFFTKYPMGKVPVKKVPLSKRPVDPSPDEYAALPPLSKAEQAANAKIAPKPSTRKPARSPLVMAIDHEIKELKEKIRRLEQVRKEFS